MKDTEEMETMRNMMCYSELHLFYNTLWKLLYITLIKVIVYKLIVFKLQVIQEIHY